MVAGLNGGGLAPSVYVAVAHTRDFAGGVLDAFCAYAARYGLTPHRVEGQPIDVARNLLVEDALRQNAEHILMWDSDMTPHPDGLNRLLSRGVDIVSGLSFGRTAPHWPIDYDVDTGDLDINGVLRYVQKHPALFESRFRGAVLPDVRLKPQPIVGMAFTLIKTKVFRAIPPPWYSFPKVHDGRGEDMMFSQLARKHGFECFLDWSVVVGHGYGDQSIGPRDFVNYVAYMEATTNAIPN